MTKPMENKSNEIKSFIEEVFPGTAEAIDKRNCPLCKKPITGFKNALSQKEYLISGMCQECQDSIFESDPDS